MLSFSNDYVVGIVSDVLGGALVALLSVMYLKTTVRFRGWNFKRIFGDDAAKEFFLVYARIRAKEDPSVQWQYYKQYKPSEVGLFKVSSVVPFPETKAVKYLSESFSEAIKNTPKLISDEEEIIKSKLDVSFCSFGGYSNLKTIDILERKENVFFHFDLSQESKEPSIIVNEGNKDAGKKFYIDGVNDYGVIIKIRPGNFPNRVWLCAAGLGEWGTSGAAWYLAKKWKNLPKNKSFGMIIRVRAGQDESAEMVHLIEK